MSRKQTLRQILDRMGVKSPTGYAKKPRKWTTEQPVPVPVRIEPDDAYITVRYDLLRFLLEKGHIDKWQFCVGRAFQGVYQHSLIQPPQCILGNMDHGKGFTNNQSNTRADVERPADGTFKAIKKMAEVSERLQSSDWRAAKNILCKYSLEDETGMELAKHLIHKNPTLMSSLLDKIGWAMGMTTRNPYELPTEKTQLGEAIILARDKRKRFNLHLEPRYREAS